MNNEYIKPLIEILSITDDIITDSPSIPDFEEDDTELPKLDW